MPKYRSDLPQLESDSFLTDGGLETALIYLHGVELPHFAAFPLVDSAEGRRELTRYYETFLEISAERNQGFLLDSPTWRASKDWGPRLGYDLAGLRRVNQDSIRLLEELRKRWEKTATPCVINGAIGPRGDGYKDGNMDPHEAEDYHAFQVEAFAATEADMVSAITMNNVGEAIGIARAAEAHDIPCVVSFTVETDGRLVNGTTLRRAVETVEEATAGSPVYYMVNCAHPSHFADALERGEAWVKRIQGVRANASAKSHAELDDSTSLDIGDIDDLARRYRALRRDFPAMRVLGGCCGTDHRHLKAISDACLPVAA